MYQIENLEKKFLQNIYKEYLNSPEFPSLQKVETFFESLFAALFPLRGEFEMESVEDLGAHFQILKRDFIALIKNGNESKARLVAEAFFEEIPNIYTLIQSDLDATFEGDPAAKSKEEIVRSYPGFYAIVAHRISNCLYNLKVKTLPRTISEIAHGKTGIDIHPGATIAERFCIDHGTGIVIGETTHIGKNVKIYQGVTLGALSVKKELASVKRHPTIEDGVVIYAGATILGGDTVVGKNSVIGGNVWLPKSVPPGTKIYYKAQMHDNGSDKVDTYLYTYPEDKHEYFLMKLFDLIGNTPLVEIKTLCLNKPKVKIFGKLEGNNPGGSVKDRAAYGMLKGAIDRGDIKIGSKIVEATSGNTGIALAMVGQQLGIDVTLIMPDSATEERKKVMKAYGAKLILTPGAKTIEYSRALALEMADSGEYFLLNQFGNPDNYLMHYKTTGPEIWKQTEGRITHFVSSMGTTGTIMGVSRFLKEKNPNIQIIGCQPKEGSRIPGIRKWSPEMLPEFYEPSRIDKIIYLDENDAKTTTRRMAKEEGIFAGMSSGGAMFAALQVAEEIEEGLIVSIVCDRGDRYLSSDLF